MHLHYRGNEAGRWLLAIVLLSLFSIEACAADHDAQAPKATVSFRATSGGLILVDASFGNGELHTFLLDSGSALGVLDQTIAIEAGLKKKKDIKTLVHMENSSSVVVNTNDWREATIVQKNGTKVTLIKGALPTVDLSAFSKFIGSPVAGFIGTAVLSRYVVEIDYTTDKLSFFEPSKFQYSGPGQVLPLEIRENLFVIEAQIEFADCTLAPVHLSVDSGSNSDVTLNPFFVQSHPNIGSRKLDSRSFSLGGSMDGSLGDLHSLRIGSYSVLIPNTLLLHSDSTKTMDSLVNGTLDAGILKMFTIFVDRPDNKIIFEPRTDEPIAPVSTCVHSSTSRLQPPG